MKTALCLLAATVLLSGCSKSAAPAGVTKWEYKVVTFENFEHHMHELADQEFTTNTDLGLQDLVYADRDAGDFHLDFFPTNVADLNNSMSTDIYSLGNQGWELVSAVPQTETIYAKDDVGSSREYSNVRTGKIILIFKRPAQ